MSGCVGEFCVFLENCFFVCDVCGFLIFKMYIDVIVFNNCGGVGMVVFGVDFDGFVIVLLKDFEILFYVVLI